jgi:DNA-binding response OmpR family regulator
MEVYRRGTVVQLTTQEFKMLRCFLMNADRVISEEELLQQAWGSRAQPGSRTVATHVLRLRQKIEKDPAKPVHLRTVHGAGYKFLR